MFLLFCTNGILDPLKNVFFVELYGTNRILIVCSKGFYSTMKLKYSFKRHGAGQVQTWMEKIMKWLHSVWEKLITEKLKISTSLSFSHHPPFFLEHEAA